jgi:hypothetical protein
MSRWKSSGTWTGEGLQREVFYFPSEGRQLYGSLYLPLTRARPFGIVICGSWGVEADRTNGMLRELAFGSAELGLAAMIFQYPGQGDSRGIMLDRTIREQTQSALDASAQGSHRRDVEWIFVGLRLGAVIAARAAGVLGSRRVLLIEPALDPAAYFAELTGAAQRASLGVTPPVGFAFGYAVPPAIRDDADPLAGVTPKEGAVIRYACPAPVNAVLGNLEVVERPGTWHFLQHRHPELVAATLGWLDRATAVSG